MMDISCPAESNGGRQFHPQNTFGEFVVGTSNRLAHAASIAAADKPGSMYNPLFLYGGVGLGKTHLASAIGHRLQNDGEGLRRVIFMSAESFTNELIGSLKTNKMGEFQAKFRGADASFLTTSSSSPTASGLRRNCFTPLIRCVPRTTRSC